MLLPNPTSGYWMNTDRPGARVFFVCPPQDSTALGAAAAKGKTGTGIGPSDEHDGQAPERPLATLTQAHAYCTANRGDTIALLPGTLNLDNESNNSAGTAGTIAITKADVLLTAAHPVGPREYPNVTISSTTDASMLEVDASNVTVHSLRFDDNVGGTATAGTAAIDVNTANTGVDVEGVRILNCWIDQTGMTDSDKDGISLGTDASDGAIASLVQGCTIIEAGRDAIVINVGSELTEIRNCKIFDIADVTTNGINVLATSCTIDGCDILTSGADGTGCIANGVAAARLVVNNCTLAAWGADTACIYVIATATQRTHNNHMTATAQHNFVNYITDNTTPSADTGFENYFAATSPLATMSNSSDDGAGGN